MAYVFKRSLNNLCLKDCTNFITLLLCMFFFKCTICTTLTIMISHSLCLTYPPPNPPFVSQPLSLFTSQANQVQSHNTEQYGALRTPSTYATNYKPLLSTFRINFSVHCRLRISKCVHIHPPTAVTRPCVLSVAELQLRSVERCSWCLRFTTSSCTLENKHVVLTHVTTQGLPERTLWPSSGPSVNKDY